MLNFPGMNSDWWNYRISKTYSNIGIRRLKIHNSIWNLSCENGFSVIHIVHFWTFTPLFTWNRLCFPKTVSLGINCLPPFEEQKGSSHVWCVQKQQLITVLNIFLFVKHTPNLTHIQTISERILISFSVIVFWNQNLNLFFQKRNWQFALIFERLNSLYNKEALSVGSNLSTCILYSLLYSISAL